MTPQQLNTMKLALFALDIVKIHYTQSRHINEAITAIKEVLAEHAMSEVQRLGQEIEQEPVAWMSEHDVGFRKSEFGATPTVPLYTTPPQRTERPVDCERCNRLEEQAYDLVGELRVANIKLSMRPQRTWVGLTDEEIWEAVSRIGTSDSDVNPYAKLADARAIEAKLKEKNT